MNQLELSKLFEYTDVYHSITTQDNNAVITIDSCAGYDHIITLINATGIPKSEYDYIYFRECAFINELNKYHLAGETARFTDDTEEAFEIEFDDAIADVKVYKAQEVMFSDTPWQHLQDIAITIYNKYSLSADCLNAKEQECFPIILELCKLSYRMVLPNEHDTPYFPELKKYMTKYNYPKLLALTEKLETHYYDDKKGNRLAHKLLAELNFRQYEPMWRELHDILEASQSEYPTKVSVLYPREQLELKRKEISQLLKERGYTGTYPDFVKTGSINGLRVAETYDMGHLIFLEKNVIYHIHCVEEYFNEHLMIEFLCGTELLRKGEEQGDIYSCLFNANGRRYFNVVSYQSDFIDENGEIKSDDLNTYIDIAVKKAELKKLTKEERKLLQLDAPMWLMFLLFFVIVGGLFGIFMTVGLMAISIVIALVFGQPYTIPSMITDIPWWKCLAFCWIAFGGIMGFITILTKHK